MESSAESLAWKSGGFELELVGFLELDSPPVPVQATAGLVVGLCSAGREGQVRRGLVRAASQSALEQAGGEG